MNSTVFRQKHRTGLPPVCPEFHRKEVRVWSRLKNGWKSDWPFPPGHFRLWIPEYHTSLNHVTVFSENQPDSLCIRHKPLYRKFPGCCRWNLCLPLSCSCINCFSISRFFYSAPVDLKQNSWSPDTVAKKVLNLFEWHQSSFGTLEYCFYRQ